MRGHGLEKRKNKIMYNQPTLKVNESLEQTDYRNLNNILETLRGQNTFNAEIMHSIINVIDKIKPLPSRQAPQQKDAVPKPPPESIIDCLLEEVYRYRKFNEDWDFISQHLNTFI